MSALPPVRRLRFTKMHGAGNDFVVMDLRDGTPPPDPALAARLADRHRGVGCDQILTIEAARSTGAVAAYRIWNSDGSQAWQCGNGARCVAAWLVRAGQASGERFWLDSPVNTHEVQRRGAEGYAIVMGVPQFLPAQIPLAGFDQAQDEYDVRLDEDLRLRFGAVSMGNPHAVVEVPEVASAPVRLYGPALQQSRWFPESVNVGFAQVMARDQVGLRVYERGVGETLACGSGACAAVAVLIRRGRVDRAVTVSLPGGDLQIDWPADAAPMVMAGPAAFVFEGECEA